MSKTPLLFMDFDGVWNPINSYRVWCGEGEPTDLDYAVAESFGDSKNWRTEQYPIDNETHYTPDRNKVVKFQTSRAVFIQWSTELVEEMNQLIHSQALEYWWLTTWKHDAELILNPEMKLDAKPTNWIDEPVSTYSRNFFIDHYDHLQTGKWLALKEFYQKIPKNQRPPFIWIDDVATAFYENAYNPTNKRASEELGVECLVIQTDQVHGISREQMSMVREFISS